MRNKNFGLDGCFLFTNTYFKKNGEEEITRGGSIYSDKFKMAEDGKEQKMVYLNTQVTDTEEAKNMLSEIQRITNLMGDPEEDKISIIPISDMELYGNKIYFRVLLRNGYDYPVNNLNMWGEVVSINDKRSLFDFLVTIGAELIREVPGKATTTILLNIPYDERFEGLDLGNEEFFIFSNTTFDKVEGK